MSSKQQLTNRIRQPVTAHCLSWLAADAWYREMPHPVIELIQQVGGIDDT